MKKKIIVPIAVLTAGAMMLTGCSNNSASAATRRSYDAARKTESIVSKLDTYTDAHFNFPRSMNSIQTQDYVGVQHFNEDYIQHANMSRAKRTGMFSRKKLNENPHRYVGRGKVQNRDFYNRLDSIHELCRSISECNMKKSGLINEVLNEAQALRNNANYMRGKRLHGADFSGFEQYRESLNSSLRNLQRERGKIARDVRMIPRNNRNINVDVMNSRYYTIMNKLESRTQTLENVRDNLRGMNNELERIVRPENSRRHTNRRFTNEARTNRNETVRTNNTTRQHPVTQNPRNIENEMPSNMFHQNEIQTNETTVIRTPNPGAVTNHFSQPRAGKTEGNNSAFSPNLNRAREEQVRRAEMTRKQQTAEQAQRARSKQPRIAQSIENENVLPSTVAGFTNNENTYVQERNAHIMPQDEAQAMQPRRCNGGRCHPQRSAGNDVVRPAS